MRILFLSNYGLPHLGGIEVVVDAMARELSARGHEVRHVTAASLRPGEELTPNDVYQVIRVPAGNLLERAAGVPFPIFGPSLVETLRDEIARADVVHAHGNLFLNSVAALVLARAVRRPVRILTEHVGHVDYESRLLDHTEKLAIATMGRFATRCAEAIVVLNAKVWREMASLAPGSRIVQIQNGVDRTRYRPPTAGEREAMRKQLGWDARPRVLFVGRLVKKKRADLAVAAAVAAHGAFELVIVGPGRLEGDTPAHVETLGGQPAERVAEIYRAADAFLLPSHGEGFPLTAQEAMASGLPVILANDPSYEPYVSGAGPGVRLVEPDADIIAREVSGLLADPVLRAESGAAAARHAHARFSWSRCVDEHLALYEAVRVARQNQRPTGLARFVDLAARRVMGTS